MKKQHRHHDKALPLVRRPHPMRDLIEGLLTALVLALIIRHFVFEVFQIPTGSMAPTLLGQHRDLVCPDCGLRFPVDASDVDGRPKVISAACPNCRYAFATDIVARTHCTCFPARPVRLFGRGSNRVIANKFLNRFHPPKRWEVVVFKYPLVDIVCKECGSRTPDLEEEDADHCPDCGSHRIRVERKNYIKRVVGMPGESIEIRHGNIYINGKIARKPAIVQEDLWQLVCDSAFQPKWPVPELTPRWAAESGSFFSDPETGALDLMPDETGRVRIRYAPKIKNFQAYNDLRRNTDLRFAGDLRWRLKARLREPGALLLKLVDGNTAYSAEVNFGTAEGTRTSIKIDEKVVAESDFNAALHIEHSIAFSHVDDRLELKVDGKAILSHEYDIPSQDVSESAWASGASIGTEGSEASLLHVVLERDIYYTHSGQGRFEYAPKCNIPQDSYFVLGDNSRNSRDSRYWGFVPTHNLIGEAVVVWWPLSHLKPIQ